jgi:anti-sigma regulatory factor (Ser/Thr protein kinase)
VDLTLSDASTSPDMATFDLPNDDSAPSQARRAVRQTFGQWRLYSCVDEAVLTVSELVTNAVRHGLPPISLLLRRRTDQVRMDVADGRPEPLRRIPRAVGLDESGRGLAIVREISDDFGSDRIPGKGKSVHASWSILDAPRAKYSPNARASAISALR